MASLRAFFNITRNYSNWSPVQRALQTKQNMVAQNIYIEYQDYLPKLINNTLSNEKFAPLPEIKERIQQLTEYNIIGGKQLRGLFTLFTYETLKKPDALTKKQWEDGYKLAWAIEILQSVLLISDDVEDDAETRRGKKCWHLLPDVGLLVVNDCCMLRSFLYEMLRQNFGGSPQFPKIIDLINQTFLNTSMGQHIDNMFSYEKYPHEFTEENYRKMSIYKTSHYTFRLPLLMAMIYAQKGTKESFDYVDNIGNEIGINLQMQNDFMDCFIDENTMGKTSTDIPKGKLSWLAVEALKRSNTAQRKEFKECYGKPDPAYVQRIKNLYMDLDLPQICREIEKDRYDNILKRINDLPAGAIPSQEIFLKGLGLIDKKTQVLDYSS
ncbi:uncharacterized protein [Battus philenor]|uniref:uncharacterized protein n=1 Tax=Battus philenor TaxID=42288 RepID=UPI0035CFF55B